MSMVRFVTDRGPVWADPSRLLEVRLRVMNDDGHAVYDLELTYASAAGGGDIYDRSHRLRDHEQAMSAITAFQLAYDPNDFLEQPRQQPRAPRRAARQQGRFSANAIVVPTDAVSLQPGDDAPF